MDDKIQLIRERMWQILEAAGIEPHSNSKPDNGNQSVILSGDKDTSVTWMFDKWRQISIPDWRRILKCSIEEKNLEREKYARWMLREVLEDPEYQEGKSGY